MAGLVIVEVTPLKRATTMTERLDGRPSSPGIQKGCWLGHRAMGGQLSRHPATGQSRTR
jgi:hypothetical protein